MVDINLTIPNLHVDDLNILKDRDRQNEWKKPRATVFCAQKNPY